MKLTFSENYEMPDYRTFKCSNCSYSADVVGFKQSDFNGTYETINCKNCKILIDSLTEESICIDSIKSIYLLNPVSPVCYVCNESNNELWDIQTAKCPKCNCKMKITRLILKPNDNDIDDIKII